MRGKENGKEKWKRLKIQNKRTTRKQKRWLILGNKEEIEQVYRVYHKTRAMLHIVSQSKSNKFTKLCRTTGHNVGSDEINHNIPTTLGTLATEVTGL